MRYNRVMYLVIHDDWDKEVIIINIHNLDKEICIKLLKQLGYYSVICYTTSIYNLGNNIAKKAIEEILTPEFFIEAGYNDIEIMYESFSEVDEKFMRKMIKLWEGIDDKSYWAGSAKEYYKSIKKNYKQYIREAVIQEIIE